MAGEEILLKLNFLEQQADERKHQIEELERQAADLTDLKDSLKALEEKKSGEILSNLGRGIFLKTGVEDEKVFVNIGSKTLVRKTFQETREILDKQIMEIEKLRQELFKGIEEINLSLYRLLEEAQKTEKEAEKRE